MFESLGAERDLSETQAAAANIPAVEMGAHVGTSIDADDAIVRRLVDASAFAELLAHETAAAIRDMLDAECAVVFVAAGEADIRLVAWSGCDADRARTVAIRALGRSHGTGWIATERIGRDHDGHRFAAIFSTRPIEDGSRRRLRMIGAVATQGFDLCAA